MTLDDYLRQTYPGLSSYRADKEFAEKIGTNHQNINRYRRFLRWPSPEMIARIRAGSDGLVTADDHLPPQYRETAAELRRSA
jgi:hypothetical protein